jgi:ABC-type bacteriocin/lantibiotic exporter with double-glycine peptidase domain
MKTGFLLLAALFLGAGASALGYLLFRGPQSAAAGPENVLEQVDPECPCSVVCVVATARILGRPVEVSHAREVVSVDGLGRTSMAELVDGLHRLQFAALGGKLEPRSLDRLPAPVILYVNRAHFLVALPVGDGSVVVVDPPTPIRAEPIAVLAGRWTGEAIIVRNSPEELRTAVAALGIPETSVVPAD